MSDFILTGFERNSGLWLRLKQHLENRRAELREQNDDINSTEAHTAVRRGRIREINDLLALDKPGAAP